MDTREFEPRLLDLLYRTQVKITPPHVAYYLRIPIAEAEKHLDRMAEQGVLHKECELESGAVEYQHPGRTLLPESPDLPRPLLHEPPRLALHGSPVVAVLLSILCPGTGHIYAGHTSAGIAWMVATFVGYVMLIVPGLIVHALCIASAAAMTRYRFSIS